jgi:hypothetical protein
LTLLLKPQINLTEERIAQIFGPSLETHAEVVGILDIQKLYDGKYMITWEMKVTPKSMTWGNFLFLRQMPVSYEDPRANNYQATVIKDTNQINSLH